MMTMCKYLYLFLVLTKSNYKCILFCSKKVSLPTREESSKYLLVGIFKHATVEAHSDCNSASSTGDYTQSNITVNCAHALYY